MADEDDENENDDDGIDAGYDGSGVRRKRRSKRAKVKFPAVPSEEGRSLMESGTFGSNEYYKDMLKKKKPGVARRLMDRELGINPGQTRRTNRLISQVRDHTYL